MRNVIFVLFMLSSIITASHAVTFIYDDEFSLQDPRPNTDGNSNVQLGKWATIIEPAQTIEDPSNPGEFINLPESTSRQFFQNVPGYRFNKDNKQPGDIIEVLDTNTNEIILFTVLGNADEASGVKDASTVLSDGILNEETHELTKNPEGTWYLHEKEVEESTPPMEPEAAVEEALEVQGPVQPANAKSKSKADKLVDGITDTWKSINSLDDICHAGNIYLQSPEVNGFSLQYKNEKCEEYFGVKFTLKF